MARRRRQLSELADEAVAARVTRHDRDGEAMSKLRMECGACGSEIVRAYVPGDAEAAEFLTDLYNGSAIALKGFFNPDQTITTWSLKSSAHILDEMLTCVRRITSDPA